ncbi:Hypothetical protein I595_3030 [Croceitalea dokdonensis DOKDO 023]|uniref:Uncharacterized protein n=1 Tax=Croceitalea dokdonensis DOKDO 023 TaxID=1300341 RepID=A0A0P7AXJ0_9FLAO|nr:Hypothetical protein I595_3030 [Croceitalea dokdonensis DOKDO 023]
MSKEINKTFAALPFKQSLQYLIRFQIVSGEPLKINPKLNLNDQNLNV